MGVTPQEVLADIEGWEGATLVELDGGLNNSTWRLDKNGRSAVLKVDERPRGRPFNSRRQEAEIQSRAFEAGLANRVLFVTDTVYLTEYVEGVVWSPKCLDDDENIEKLAVAVRKLHSLPLTGRLFDAAGSARDYAGRIGDSDRRKVRDCVRTIEAAPPPQNLCCCHNDLVVQNIINSPETRFLDWEYAGDNDPFFDLATVAAHHDMSPGQQATLLDAYFDGDGRRWRHQLKRQVQIYNALLYLWQRSRE